MPKPVLMPTQTPTQKCMAGFFSPGESNRDLELKTGLHHVSNLRVCGVKPPPFCVSIWHEQCRRELLTTLKAYPFTAQWQLCALPASNSRKVCPIY